VAILKAHHMNRDKIDWPAVEAQAQGMLGEKTAAADAYPAIRTVIRQLGEKHTSLMPADGAKALMTGQKVGNVRPPDDRTPEGYSLAGGIGLITLKTHLFSPAADIVYAKAARDALATFARAHICRYIVDLRGNGGGNMYPMINGLQALLGREPYLYSQDLNAPETPQTLANASYLPVGDAAASRRQRDLQDAAPVAVLMDRGTASSGEFTAMAFEGRPRTRFFGEPTAGYLTMNSRYDLPDGAFLAVSTGWGTDRLHRSYRETIAPDEATPRGQATLDAAIAWLKKQPCRKAL
jgi:C-terminal processing protease CtpA/Prc